MTSGRPVALARVRAAGEVDTRVRVRTGRGGDCRVPRRALGLRWARGEESVFLKTISRQLAVDVQTLLLRLGIRSSVYESSYLAAENGATVERMAYQVSTRGTRRFATLIQPLLLTHKRLIETSAEDTSLTVDRATAIGEVEARVPVGAAILGQHASQAARLRSRDSVKAVASAVDELELPVTSRAARVAWQEIVAIEHCRR